MSYEVEYGSAFTVTSPTGPRRRHVIACLDVVHDFPRVAPLLEGRRVAAVLADPPYSSGGLHAGQRRRSTSEKYQHDHGGGRKYLDWSGDSRDQRSWIRWSAAWLADLWRVSDPETYAFIFSDWRQVPALSDAVQMSGWTWRGMAVWDKGNAVRAPHLGYFRHQSEYIVWGTAGQLAARFEKGRPMVRGVFQCPPPRGAEKVHLAQKPVEVLRWLLSIVDGREGVVLDPFAGSASGLLAAGAVGFESVSFECSPEILTVGLDRLAEVGFEVEACETITKPPEEPTKPSPAWEGRFLAALERCGSVTRACQLVGVSRSTVYRWRRRCGSFADRWEGA